MIPDAVVNTGVRRTALLLHTLAERDRSAMLARFAPGERAMLTGLLDELAVLGIPRDRALLDQTMATLAPADAVDDTSSDLIDRLQSAPVQDISRVLHDEPVELIARLLVCAQWCWSADLMATLEPLRRRQVQSYLHETKHVAPRMNDTLLRVVCAALGDLHLRPAMPQSVSNTRWINVWSRLRRSSKERA